MAKKVNKAEIVSVGITTLEDLSKEELEVRYNDNVAERKRLAEENKMLIELHKTATSTAKATKAAEKLAYYQAQLAALQNPTVKETPAPVAEVASEITDALAG